MTLPQIPQPLFDITIPSLKKKIKFRSYLCNEEKILLMAREGSEESSDQDIINAVKQVINNCCQDDTIDVDKLATFDLDYIFLKLYSKSVNNLVKVAYRDLEDEKTYSFEIDLDTIQLSEDPNHDNKVKVNDDVTLSLRYPTLEIVDSLVAAKNSAEIFDTMLLNCVDKIYDKETVYTEYSQEELKDFLGNLTVNALEQIKAFFASLPKLEHIIEYTNEKGTERTIELSNLRDFFSW